EFIHDCFFFSSRRRHTRFSRDWSSDVCSSDLSILRIQYGKIFQAVTRSSDALPTSRISKMNNVSKVEGNVWREPFANVAVHLARSEERRVGKVCRALWGLDQQKKKKTLWTHCI